MRLSNHLRLSSPQLKLVDSPLPTFFCFKTCCVFVSDSSPPSYANADVENIPISATAVRIAAIELNAVVHWGI